MSKVYVTWEDVDKFVDDTANVLNNMGLRVSGVYGIPRGGLVMAVMLSHKLHVPMLMSPTPNCLIVDDICDTGESLLHYIKNSSSLNKPSFVTATMFYKDNRLGVKPSIYGKLKGDAWIVFPWEDKEG